MFQEVLLERIKKELRGKSLNDTVAVVLQISYDAAHRRTSLKSKISLDEAVLLAKHFNFSLDTLYGEAVKNYVSVEKTLQIKNEDSLREYFDTSYNLLVETAKDKSFKIYYSAKDIPLFYLIDDSILSRFKIYVWMKLLCTEFRNVRFDNFYPKLSTIQAGKRLGDFYSFLNVSEIWDTTTINSTLKQIYFYYEAGQISAMEAMSLCRELKVLLNKISEKVLENKGFELYYNELLLMNNNVLVFNQEQQLLFVPNSMLSYFKTTDSETCLEAKNYMESQIKHSKLLNTSGEKEQNKFYNKMMQKINALISLIKADSILDFE